MLFAILFGLPILIATPIALIGSSFLQAGKIHVSVVDKTEGGCSVDVAVPAAIAPLAARIGKACSLPCGNFGPEARAALELAGAALAAMASSPDGVYVEVRSADEIVVVSKRDGVLQVDVDTRDETVHASIPLAAARSVLSVI
jgi:hypothetical protein